MLSDRNFATRLNPPLWLKQFYLFTTFRLRVSLLFFFRLLDIRTLKFMIRPFNILSIFFGLKYQIITCSPTHLFTIYTIGPSHFSVKIDSISEKNLCIFRLKSHFFFGFIIMFSTNFAETRISKYHRTKSPPTHIEY